MQSSMILLVCLLAVNCTCKVSLKVQYTQQSSWLVSLDGDHLVSFLQCLCVHTSIECNLRLDSSSGYATGMDIIEREQSDSVSNLFSQYVCTFFHSNHSVLCKRQSIDHFLNSTPLFVIESPSQCELQCVEWRWTDQQTVSLFQKTNYDLRLRYNETDSTCISNATMSTSMSVTRSKQIITTANSVPYTSTKSDALFTTLLLTQQSTVKSYTTTVTGPLAPTNSVSDTAGDGLQGKSATETSPDHGPTLTATLQTSTNEFAKEDVNTIITTGIIIGIVVGCSVLLTIIVILIFLCRRRINQVMASKNKQDFPQNSKNLSHSEKHSGNSDPGHNNNKGVTDMNTYDMYVDNFIPILNHAASDNSNSSFMPFVKTSGKKTLYSNQSVYDNVKKSHLIGATSDPNNRTMALQLSEDKFKILVSETQSLGPDSNTYTEPVDTFRDIHFKDRAHTYLQLQEEHVDGQNASTLREHTSSPHYSIATIVNVCPDFNYTKPQEDTDTKQTIALYNKLGEFGRNKRNWYDEISDQVKQK